MMTSKEAIEILRKNKPTYDPRECGKELCEACDVAIEALEKADKYRWHDLRKDPEDLPTHWDYVLITTYKNEVYVASVDHLLHTWVLRDDEFDYCDIGSSIVKAWREIEPFASDTNVGRKEVEVSND